MTGTEIILVRHGEAWDRLPDGSAAPGSIQGLSGAGARQSRLLAAAFAQETESRGAFGGLYTCPSLRCLETAGPIATALGLDFRIAEPLRTPESSMLTRDGALIPAPRRMDGSAWWDGYAHRAGEFLLSLACTHGGQRVLVVGHGATQRAAMVAFLRLPPGPGSWGAPLAYGALSRWVHHGDGDGDPAGIWALTAHNEAAHLDRPDIRPQLPQLADIRRQRAEAPTGRARALGEPVAGAPGGA